MNRKSAHLLCAAIALCLLLNGCISDPSADIHLIPTAPIKNSPTLSPTATPLVTQSETHSNEVNPTPTKPIRCNNEGSPKSAAGDFGYPGSLLISDFGREGYYLINQSNPSGVRLSIPWQSGVYNVGFSPDGSTLSYIVNKSNLVMITEAGLTLTKKINLDQVKTYVSEDLIIVGFGYMNWLNERMMYLHVLTTEDPDNSTVSPEEVFLNPVTGEIESPLANNLPEYALGKPFFLSPDLTRVFFQTDAESGKNFAIWSLDNQQELWNKPSSEEFASGLIDLRFATSLFDWSADSKKMAFVDEIQETYRIRILSRDGSELGVLTPPNSQSIPYVISWSPTGRFIAYVGSENNEIWPKSIFVYDTEKDLMVLTCPIENDQTSIAELFWSSDEKLIAYSFPFASPLNIINIDSGDVAQVAESIILHGWSGIFSAPDE